MLLNRNRTLFGVAAVAAAAILAACGSSSSTSSSSTTAPGATAAITTTLHHMPTGTVKLTWSPATKHLVAAFNMYGFTPTSSHAVHLHLGSCLNQGKVLIPFPDLTANSGGAFTGTLTSTTSTPNGIPSGTYFNVHLAPTAQLGLPGSLGFTPIACDNVPSGTTDSVTLSMKAPPQTGQNPTGTATLSYDATAKKLTVNVSMTGLVPGSVHAAHVHLGSCQSQGPVKYPLTSLTADSSGAAKATTVIPNIASPPPSSGWYVNTHLGSPSQLLSANKSPTLYFQPIACGNVR